MCGGVWLQRDFLSEFGLFTEGWRTVFSMPFSFGTSHPIIRHFLLTLAKSTQSCILTWSYSYTIRKSFKSLLLVFENKVIRQDTCKTFGLNFTFRSSVLNIVSAFSKSIQKSIPLSQMHGTFFLNTGKMNTHTIVLLMLLLLFVIFALYRLYIFTFFGKNLLEFLESSSIFPPFWQWNASYWV